MKANILIVMVATAFLMAACGSSKNASTVVNDDALSVLKPKGNAAQATPPQKPVPPKVAAAEMVEEIKKDAVEEIDEKAAAATEMMDKAEEAIVKSPSTTAAEVEKKVMETKENVNSQPSKVLEENAEEMMAKKAAAAKKAATKLSTLETETLEINEDKVIEGEVVEAAAEKPTPQAEESASNQNQEKQMNLAGKYKWVKRVCCGRMRVVTTPQDGEEMIMEMTEDGKILYSGNSQKKLEDTAYEMKRNSMSFPDREMLKIEGKIDALIKFRGDTLIIDRGYIDLDKNFWVKIKE